MKNSFIVTAIAISLVIVVACNRDAPQLVVNSEVKLDGQPDQDGFMTEWKDLMTAQHDVSCDGSDEFQLLTGSPVNSKEIAQLEQKYSVIVPNEFKEFYSRFDGYGTSYEKHGDTKNDWLILPIERIRLLSEISENWKSELHRTAAERLLVIIDFETGDCAGYKLNDAGEIGSQKLYIFAHERRDATPNQDVDEFIFEYWDGIEAFLKDHEWAW